ncbi:MAG: HAMP domain-containing sensor histidine kinase [Rhodothermales bacterium]
MLLLSVLIGLAGLSWALSVYARYSDRRVLLAAGLPALFIVVDAWTWTSPSTLSTLWHVLWMATHVYVLGMVVWMTQLVKRRADLVERHARELDEARNDSVAMRRLKTAFLANMNHEIRTPLTSIIGFSSLLSSEVEPEHGNMMRVIERSGQRLLDTLDSFLDLAMLEAGRVQLAREVVDLAEEARFHAARFGPLARGKGLSLEVSTPPNPVRALVDRSCMSRIYSRMISNAIKFTEEGSVSLDVRASNGRCHVSIQDTGIGIDDEYLPYLFSEFTQASTGTGRAFEGSGLGLAVTKRLVDLLDGTIEVETKQFEGSTFVITLPAFVPGGDGAESVEPPLLSTQRNERKHVVR